MKKRKTLITGFIALILLVTSAFSYWTVYAATEKANVSFSFTALEGESISDLVVDLYKVAEIEWKGQGIQTEDGKVHTSYVVKDSLYKADLADGLDIGIDITDPKNPKYWNESLSDEEIDKIAERIAGKITPETAKAYSNKLSYVDDNAVEEGIYLAFVHSAADKNLSDYTKTISKTETKTDADGNPTVVTKDHFVTYANSEKHEYDFKPLLVFINHDQNNGDFPETVELKYQLKYTVDYLYEGKFIIEKELENFDSSKGSVSFVFHYTVVCNDAYVSEEINYDDYIGLTFTGKATIATEISHIPVGATVTVQEEHDGAYKLSEGITNPQSYEIVLTPVHKFVFKNKIDNDPKHGYGIDNTYSYDKVKKVFEHTGTNVINDPTEVTPGTTSENGTGGQQ